MKLADSISLALAPAQVRPLHGDDGADRGDDRARHRRRRRRLRRAPPAARTLNFFEELYPWPAQVTALGLNEGARFRSRYPEARYVQGDALRPAVRGRRLRDRLLERRDRARRRARASSGRFVAEALRVARRAFVTTPNRWFPVEVHTRLPLVHWLPDGLAHRAYDLARKPWAKENHLLGPGALRDLLPPGTRVVNLGMTLVAVVELTAPALGPVRVRRRAPAPQPRHGRALGRGRPRPGARRRVGLEGGAARAGARRDRVAPPRHPVLARRRPTGSRSPIPASSSSTRSSPRTGSAATPRREASSTASATT